MGQRIDHRNLGELCLGRGYKERSENHFKAALEISLRKADKKGLEKLVSEEDKSNALSHCKGIVDKLNLPMKLVGL